MLARLCHGDAQLGLLLAGTCLSMFGLGSCAGSYFIVRESFNPMLFNHDLDKVVAQAAYLIFLER